MFLIFPFVGFCCFVSIIFLPKDKWKQHHLLLWFIPVIIANVCTFWVSFLYFVLKKSLSVHCSDLSLVGFSTLKIIGNSPSLGSVDHPEHSGRRLGHVGTTRQQRPIPSIGQWGLSHEQTPHPTGPLMLVLLIPYVPPPCELRCSSHRRSLQNHLDPCLVACCSSQSQAVFAEGFMQFWGKRNRCKPDFSLWNTLTLLFYTKCLQSKNGCTSDLHLRENAACVTGAGTSVCVGEALCL